MGLKVAIIAPWLVKCGIYTYTQDLANALAKAGAEVYIVRLPRFGIKNVAILEDVVSRIPVDKVDIVTCQHEYGLYQGLDVSFYNTLKRLKKPIVTTMHAVGNWEVDGVIASVSDKVIVHNEFCKTRLGNYKNVEIIPHGATPSKAVPSGQAKKSLGIDPRIPVVGYLGFISSYKGIESIIDAMTKVENAGLLIGGGWHTDKDTEYIINLKETSLKALPNRVQWIGYVENERVPTVYGAIDILIYPSRFATESGALITALSYGKAVITSSLPPFKEKERHGALMTFANTDDLATKIKLLLNDLNLKMQLEKGAMAYAESVSWDKIAEAHISLYEQVIADRVKQESQNIVDKLQT